MFGRYLRNIFIWLLFFFAGAYSLYRELQFSFVFCSVICILIAWRQQSLQILNLLKSQLSRLTQAEFAGVTLTADPTVLRAMADLHEKEPWMATLVEGLSASHLSLMALVSDSEAHIPSSDQKDRFRELRSRGLVGVSAPMDEGGSVTLTPLGRRVLNNLKSHSSNAISNHDEGYGSIIRKLVSQILESIQNRHRP